MRSGAAERQRANILHLWGRFLSEVTSMASRSQTLTDHESIRRWAEAHGATPAAVRGTATGEDAGLLRLDVPGSAGPEPLQPIDWDQWFEKFDKSNLALRVDGELAGTEPPASLVRRAEDTDATSRKDDEFDEDAEQDDDEQSGSR
jgi:hypothetical protein